MDCCIILPSEVRARIKQRAPMLIVESYNNYKMVKDGVITSNMKSHIGFRFAYLDLTLADSKGRQSLAHFEGEYL